MSKKHSVDRTCNSENNSLQSWNIGLYVLLLTISAVVYYILKNRDVKSAKNCAIAMLVLIILNLLTFLYRYFIQNEIGYGKRCMKRDNSWKSILPCFLVSLALIIAIWVNVEIIKQLSSLETNSLQQIEIKTADDSQIVRLYSLLLFIVFTPVIFAAPQYYRFNVSK